MKRSIFTTLLLCLCLTGLLCAAVAGAEEAWTCPQCGQTGNTGAFCPSCGQKRPEADSGTWTCPQCGHTGNTGAFCPSCGQIKPDDVISEMTPVVTVNQHLEQIPGQTDRVQVRVASVEASAYIVNKSEPTRWLPDNVNDHDETTCWQFSKKKDTKLTGSWIQLNAVAAEAVDAIWFKNGFWGYNTKGDDLYVINARPKTVQVEFLYATAPAQRDVAELTLLDDTARSGWQSFSLARRENVVGVRIWVRSVYPGSRYPNDVCLSEVMLVQNAPAATAIAYTGAGEGRTYESTASRGSSLTAKLLMKLATRSGPGTEYDEPGTFFGKNWQTATVQVTGKYWDGSIWWVEVDFNYGNARYRVWTGLKRVDVNLDYVTEILPRGEGTVDATNVYRGPGSNYAKAPAMKTWKDVVAYRQENGYVEVEYYGDNGVVYRGWVPSGVAWISWGNDHSGDN